MVIKVQDPLENKKKVAIRLILGHLCHHVLDVLLIRGRVDIRAIRDRSGNLSVNH